MNKEKDTPTFCKDGKRRIKCPSCGHLLGRKDGDVIYTRLTDNKFKFYECCFCYEKFQVFPPSKELNEKGDRIIRWGANAMFTTADLTDDDLETIISSER
jgi:hypothetical protein